MLVRRLLVVAAILAATLTALLPSSPAGAAAADPVVIVPGFTTGPVIDTGYIPLRDRLRSAGYDVTVLVYPDYGLGDIRTNSQRLANTIASVRARTGAAKVDLVAHSMGGLVSRYYIKNLGGAATVDSLIMMGTPNYGTSLANVASFLTFGSCVGIDACNQMASGSSFLNDLNAGDDTIGNVRYTNIVTAQDEIIIPYTNGYLNNDGNNVNVKVQSKCWARLVGHVSIALDGTVYSGIRQALAKQAIDLDCWAL